MVGPCPKCGNENTVDLEYEPSIKDITVGACLNCGVRWCSECGYVLKGRGESCQLKDPSECNKVVQFLYPYEEDVSNCPQLRKYLKQVG